MKSKLIFALGFYQTLRSKREINPENRHFNIQSYILRLILWRINIIIDIFKYLFHTKIEDINCCVKKLKLLSSYDITDVHNHIAPNLGRM